MRKRTFKFLPLPEGFSPTYCTIEEACSYARHGLWTGFQKIKAGRWQSFKDGRTRLIVFASVLEDMERLKAEGLDKPIEPIIPYVRGVSKKPVGRPRKAQSAVAAE